jgi:hypothetical protein
VTRDDYILKNVRNVPVNIKRAVVNEALAQDITMNDVVGQILGRHCLVPYQLSGERSMGAEITGDQMLFRVPPTVDLHIRADARAKKITESSVVLQILAEYFGLVYEPTKRTGRKRSVEA